MRRAPLSLCLALFACATHHSESVALDAAAQQKEESHAAESIEIHRTEEPSRTVTTVEEFAAPEKDDRVFQAPRSSPIGFAGSPRAPFPTVPTVLPFRGPLIKLTTITEDRGAVLETATAKGSSESTGAATATIAAKADSERDSKPSLGLPVLGLVLAGIAASAILTRGIWLGPVISFLKSKL